MIPATRLQINAGRARKEPGATVSGSFSRDVFVEKFCGGLANGG